MKEILRIELDLKATDRPEQDEYVVELSDTRLHVFPGMPYELRDTSSAMREFLFDLARLIAANMQKGDHPGAIPEARVNTQKLKATIVILE